MFSLAFDVRRQLKKVLVFGGILLAANIAFYSIAVRPRVLEYRDLQGTRQRFLRELGTAEKSEKALSDFYARLTATKANTDDFYAKVLRTKQENMIHVQQELNEIGKEFQIDPDTVSYSNTDMPEDGLERFELSVLLEGDYSDLRKFIARVENSEMFLVVESISLTGTKEGGLQLQMNVNISTYFDAPWLKDMKKQARTGRRRT